ncbi:UDP-3-O-(3-hydroxymyristoyl)glucosamine N-acyltransferase [Pseudoxanthomonas composti]|uniref:UDP-3-O-(3-hydroxymyristoyl)glucosamine N-acyltransferase n=1 Tax=Pseudoxanthomonas composti TaxID=2137479 RepID=A0A4Q1JSL7_9GAMM|nr:UDP-3-O-(3-hydroxymyristoyl)glucosamine N-acyltransferase [Pseudoxanthomonas composti]RXR02656.1 UDP-3-O-(3-hydroxymyristoyl)glucosamine N-acyltransferase [Pseudoxanthomonas composti]
MKSRWVIGGSPYLDLAFHSWKQARPDEKVVRIEVPQGPDHAFDLSVLAGLDPAEGAMFAAFDERFGNLKRMELMQAAVERGFKLEPFIHPSAAIGADTVIGLNAFVGANAIVGHACRIDYNTVVHAGAHLGPNCRIKSSCWLENGVQVGTAVEIGGNGIVRTGAIVRDGVKVGRSCELGWPRVYAADVPARTYYDTRYDQPIHTYGQ